MVTEQLQEIQQRIREACSRRGRIGEAVKIVAITKTLDVETINGAIDAGLAVIGENRVQEYLGKRDALRPHSFHMIGHLQKNKVRHIAAFVDMIHSVDTLSLAVEIDKRASAVGRRIDVLLEVNSSGEANKFGLAPGEVLAEAAAIAGLPNIRLCGLMTVAEFFDNPEDARPSFRLLRQLKDELAGQLPSTPISELSMGMTNDYEVAVEEGATIVRLGTALFGHRNTN